MPSGKDFGTGKRGPTGKKNANCSFCRKSYRDVGPLGLLNRQYPTGFLDQMKTPFIRGLENG